GIRAFHVTGVQTCALPIWLDNDKIRELLTPEQLLECTKTITFNQIKCNRITGEKPKFKMPDLSNATPTGLVDMLGDVREQIKDRSEERRVGKASMKKWETN